MIKICENATPEAFKSDWKLPEILQNEVNYLKINEILVGTAIEIEKSGDIPLANGVELLAHICGMVLDLPKSWM